VEFLHEAEEENLKMHLSSEMFWMDLRDLGEGKKLELTTEGTLFSILTFFK
jgi:hypothetical protein